VTGEADLETLLREMAPRLNPGAYAYVVAPDQPVEADPVVVVREDEGTTWVLPRQDADALGLAYNYVAAWITLEVHSALEAVGLTAAVARALSDAGISANVVAGFHHDHVFVPYERAQDAVTAFHALTS
jgi:hypothetical protein